MSIPYPKCQKCKSTDGRDVYKVKVDYSKKRTAMNSPAGEGLRVQLACQACLDAHGDVADVGRGGGSGLWPHDPVVDIA